MGYRPHIVEYESVRYGACIDSFNWEPQAFGNFLDTLEIGYQTYDDESCVFFINDTDRIKSLSIVNLKEMDFSYVWHNTTSDEALGLAINAFKTLKEALNTDFCKENHGIKVVFF